MRDRRAVRRPGRARQAARGQLSGQREWLGSFEPGRAGVEQIVMIGTPQLSRTLSFRRLAGEVLEQGIHNALAGLDTTQQS